jgi:predicted Ser/Thr protein kinase
VSTITEGTLVGGFRVRELLGTGAMGTVYLAESVESGDLVALKVIAAGPSHDTRFRERFERECALAASLQHPNIVKTIASGETDGHLYLAMEYVEGSDLREILRGEAPLEPGRALRLVAQIADALDAAHELGLVHRDVKPGNILVTERGAEERALMCDFGLARHVSSVSSLTGDRGFVGTIDYVPPEQIQGNEVDRRSDLYSLACVLFECLVGAKPFERESELSVVFAHLNDAPPRPTEYRPELPDAWDEFFAKALAKEPSERSGSGRELVETARAAAAGKRRRSRPARRRLIAAVAIAAVAAGIGVGFALEDGGASRHFRPEITRTSIDGVTLRRTAAFYDRKLGGYQSSVVDPGFPTHTFEQPGVAVYFPKHSRRAFIITTWNRTFRTAEGIGPCSTLAQMHEIYGRRVVPTYHGTTHDGRHWSWQLGRSLLFMTQDQKTISEVVLFEGPPNPSSSAQPPGTHQGFASYVGENGTACE